MVQYFVGAHVGMGRTLTLISNAEYCPHMPRRFLWVVQYFVGAGFYVIPTYSPSDYSVDNTVASTPAVFLRNWANLWTAITEVRARA